MAADAFRVQITVRLNSEDKEFFGAETQRCGMDPSVAARQVLELVIQRMRAGGDFIDALHELKTSMRAPRGAVLEHQLDDAGKALGTFKPRESQEALLKRVEQLEEELQSIAAKKKRAKMAPIP